jgi:catechol 2,3-dioxygenase-like lactoylglutathione lyase family enzyme
MKQAISFITLGVRDLARSRAFYRALGWRESSASQPAVAFFQAGSVAFALFGREALAEDATVSPAGNGSPAFTLAHNVASEAAVDATLAEAVTAGARLVRPGERAPWGGYRGYFADPDGFLWEICFNPFFEMDEAGAVKLPLE